jgi:hypothetical protein
MTKKICLPALLLFSINLLAQHAVILSKTQVCYINKGIDTCKITDIPKKAFMAEYKNAMHAARPYDAVAAIITPPPEWGTKVNDSTYGNLSFHNSFKGGFVADIMLYHLLPNHRYILTLNGNPQRKGNDLLPTLINAKEKYYDFLSIITDPKGNYHKKVGIYLTPSEYDVRLYVKDTDGFKIVLYKDFFKFTVL